MEKNKDIAYQDWINMIQQSWTWERLTEDERNVFTKQIEWNRTHLKGNYNARWDILQDLYHMYLLGLGYKPQGWRIPKE